MHKMNTVLVGWFFLCLESVITTVATTTLRTTLPPKTDCRQDKADIVFLLDSSYSEGSSNFQKQLQFVRNFANNYDIGPDKVQVGVVTFATFPTLGFGLNQYHDKNSLLHAIDGVIYIPGGTYTDKALQYVRENSFNSTQGARADVPKILVVLTDGQSKNPIGTAQEARILHLINITTIAIGIGSDVVQAELYQIGSDAQHVFTVPSFDSLQSIEMETQSAACALGNIDGLTTKIQTTTITITTTTTNPAPTSTTTTPARTTTTTTTTPVPTTTTTTTTPAPTTTTTTTTPAPTTTSTTTATPAPTTTTTTPKPTTTTTTTTTPKPTTTTTTTPKPTTTTTTTTTPKPTTTTTTTTTPRPTTTTTTTPNPTTTTTTTTTHRPTTTTTTTTTHKPITTSTTTPMPTVKPDCRHDKADIVFLLDASYSEGLSNFQKQLKFVRNFTNNYDIGPDKVQVGVVTFATLPALGFHLNQYHDKASVLHAIDSVTYKPGGTNTDKALKYVRENSFNATNGGRAGVPKVLVVLTDGQSANPIGTAQEARILHFSNIKTIAIGIGSEVVKSELYEIGSDAQHVFTVPSFDSLQSIEMEIQSAACGLENIDQTSCESKLVDIVFVLDSSSSEGKPNFDMQLQFVSNLTNSFSIGPNGIQVSVVTFGTHAFNQFFLNEYSDKASLQRATHNISYQGGTTNTAEALDFTRTKSFQPQNGGRGGAVTKLVVVLTDGQSNSPTATTTAAQSLKYGGIKVIAVGIGSSLSTIELQHIASDRSHVLSVVDFNSLNTISREIERLACMTPSLCGDKPADIVFVLDASSSEGAVNFQKQLDFVTNFVNQFDIGPSYVQIGLVTFGSTAHNEFYLNAYSDKNSLIAAIQSVRYSGGTRALDSALRYVSYYLFTTTHGARVNASHTVIILTDGHSDDPSGTISEAIRLKNMNKAQVIAIGIGAGVNQFELNAMGTDRSHVFTIVSFSILHTLQTEIKDQACGAPKPKPVASTDCGHQPADIVFLLDSSASEGAENFQKQVDFVRDFVYQFTIGPNDVQVSVIVFSSSAHEQFPLNRYNNQVDLLNAIARITFNSGATYTDKALFMARNQSFLASKGARPNARDLVILLTDGQSTYPTRTATEAYLLKNQPNVKVIAIGIGSGVQMTELQRIASDSAHALAVADFNSLNAIQSELTFVACQTCSFVNKADIVFALDASSSEGPLNFHSQLDFVSRVANDFTVGVNNVQIGCVTFSDNAHLEFNLNQYHDKSSLLAAIQKVAYTQGITHTDEALQFIRQRMFTAAAGDRGDANNYVIVLTDGASTDRNATIQAANLLKQRNVVVIAIGIGSSINNAELNAIASDPRHVFTVSDFNSLRTLKSDIKAAACEEVQSTTAASPVHATTTLG